MSKYVIEDLHGFRVPEWVINEETLKKAIIHIHK